MNAAERYRFEKNLRNRSAAHRAFDNLTVEARDLLATVHSERGRLAYERAHGRSSARRLHRIAVLYRQHRAALRRQDRALRRYRTDTKRKEAPPAPSRG